MTTSHFFIIFLTISYTTLASASSLTNFLQCLHDSFDVSNPISDLIFTPDNSSSFTNVLQDYIKNKRFLSPSTPKPLAIITAKEESHISQNQGLFIRAIPQVVKGTKQDEKTIEVVFIALYLGKSENLLKHVNQRFPKLRLKQQDCIEASWVESILFWDGSPFGISIETLLDRHVKVENFYKVKSDYVKQVIPKLDLEFIWKEMIKIDKIRMQFSPYGGRMGEISSSEIPFPHRKGNLFMIGYFKRWDEDGEAAADANINKMRGFYASMAPFVSKNPRETFLCYKDLDNGMNVPSNETSFANALVYGPKYFKGNFKRLVNAKNKIDPLNFFKHEQSIPTYHAPY
ncbi:hypothetical protein ACFE04_030564 [Oxalis oulophora]